MASVTFYSNVKSVVDEQKAFKATVEARREKSHQDMEDVRTRLTKLEQWKEDK